MATINSESIVGIALIFLALLFIWAGIVNKDWSVIMPADYLILAVGAGFLGQGIRELRRSSHPHTEEHRSGYY
jgi:hypothetical protein